MYTAVFSSPKRKIKSDIQRVHKIQTSPSPIELKVPGSQQQDDHSGKLPAGLAYQTTAKSIRKIL